MPQIVPVMTFYNYRFAIKLADFYVLTRFIYKQRKIIYLTHDYDAAYMTLTPRQ